MCSTKQDTLQQRQENRCLGTKENEKGESLIPKVLHVLLSSQTLAANTLGKLHSDTSCLSCCGSATVPNGTESNDFLITLWQQYGPWHGWWQSCNWYSARPLSSQACLRARQTKATYNKILLLPAAAFVCSQLCFRSWDIVLLVTHTELHGKSPNKLVIFK